MRLTAFCVGSFVKPAVLNYGVDSLDVRVSRNKKPSLWLLEQTPVWRAHFLTYDHNPRAWESLLVEIPDVGSFQVLKSKKTYEFVLVNPEIGDIRIWNPDKWPSAVGGKTGQFYFSFRSKLLQFGGPEMARKVLEAVTAHLLGEPMQIGSQVPNNPEFDRVSRLDVFADVALDAPLTHKDAFDRFTCKARKRDVFFDPHGSSGLASALGQSLETGKGSRGRPKVTDQKAAPLLDNKGGDDYINLLVSKAGLSVSDAKKALKVLAKEGFAVVTPDAPLSRVVASGGQMQTAYFGRFQSELYCRVYDKEASLAHQHKGYMREVWAAQGWDGKRPMWRVEFSLSNDFLKAVAPEDGAPHDLRDLDTALAALPGLWAYLTGQWLQHHKPSRDKNVARWALSAFWRVVQGAFTVMQPVVRAQPEPRPDETQLKAQGRGVLVSLFAMQTSPRYLRGVNLETGEVMDDPQAKLINEWMAEILSPEFQDDVLERARRLGLDPNSDTVFSAEVRAERVALGQGS